MLDRDRFAKVCARLASTHDGEVLTAARLACGMLKDARLSWEQVLAQPKGRAAKEPRPARPAPSPSIEPFPPFPDLREILKTVNKVAEAVKSANRKPRR